MMRPEFSGAVTILSVILGTGVAFSAQAGGGPLFGVLPAGGGQEPYVRLELGQAMPSLDDASWLPHGQADPQVFFDLDANNRSFGAIAYGYDWMNGFRADASLSFTGPSSVSGPWSYTVPDSEGPHAEIADASVRTTALMGNLFYSPFQHRGTNARVQPFIVGGLGLASSRVGEWTRWNPDSDREYRTFEGATNTDIAWSVGFGVSVQLNKPGARPVMIEAAYRYYDYGTAEGGATPLPGNGSEAPRRGLNWHHTDQVVSLGIRIPLSK